MLVTHLKLLDVCHNECWLAARIWLDVLLLLYASQASLLPDAPLLPRAGHLGGGGGAREVDTSKGERDRKTTKQRPKEST